MPTTVDAIVFDSLQEAIDFVAEHGGGVVYTEIADTLFAKGLKMPKGVTLALRRSDAHQPTPATPST